MKRRLMGIGPARVITLPKKMVDNLGLKKGDEIDVVIAGNRLIITPEREAEAKKCKLHLTSKVDTMVWWTLVALYEAGYDEIEISFDTSKTLALIDRAVKDQLTGFAIVEQFEKGCIIKTITKEVDFENALRRAFLVLISYTERSLELIKNNKIEGLAELSPTESTINLLASFCLRILNKQGYKDPSKINFIYFVVRQLEIIGDMFDDINEAFLYKQIKSNEEFLRLYTIGIELLKKSYELFYQFSEDKLEEIAVIRQKFKEETRKVKDPVTSIAMRHLRRSLTEFIPSIYAFHK